MSTQEQVQIETIQIFVSKKQKEKPLAIQLLQIGNQISTLLYGKTLEQCLGKKQKISSVSSEYHKHRRFYIKMPCNLEDIKGDNKSIENYTYIINMIKHGKQEKFSIDII